MDAKTIVGIVSIGSLTILYWAGVIYSIWTLLHRVFEWHPLLRWFPLVCVILVALIWPLAFILLILSYEIEEDQEEVER